MKTAKNSDKNDLTNYFATKKRPADTSSDEFLNKRLREEKERLNSHPTDTQQEHSKSKKPKSCQDCKKKDSELEKLKKTFNDLQKVNTGLVKDNKSLKHLLSKCTKVNLEKDLKIEKLTHQREESDVSPMIFGKYEDIFEDKELTTLRSIPFTKSKDSSFILQVIRLLYKNNLDALKSRTTASKTADKSPITPEKKAVIKDLYDERLNSLKLNDFELSTRKSKLNEYTMTGITNIRKSMKRHSL